MNCKQGDVAIFVKCSPGNEEVLGHICRVLRREDHPLTGEPGWEFEPAVRIRGQEHNCAVDRALRPLRDPGDDEIDWVSHRTPRSADLHQDQLTRARQQLQEVAS